jgi:Flp pilus assembly protein TadG
MIPKMSMSRYFRLCRSEDGATAVEAAIVLSAFLLLTLGMAEFAMAYWNYSTMLVAVDEAGRYAMVYNQGPPTACGAQTQATGCPTLTSNAVANCAAAQAQTVLTNYSAPSSVAVSVSQTAGSPATMTICGSYTFNFIAPTLLPYGPISLKRQVTVPLT